MRPYEEGVDQSAYNSNAWPNPPYHNRPTGNKGNFNDSVILDRSQVQRSSRSQNRPGLYTRADALRRRIRRGR